MPPLTILVVENQPDVLALMARVLRMEGYVVTATHSGAEALTAAEAAGWAVDLLVADLKMPEMTGQKLAKNLRQHVHGLKVLYVSAGHADAVVVEQLGRGEAHFLQKPFLPVDLTTKVTEVLRLVR